MSEWIKSTNLPSTQAQWLRSYNSLALDSKKREHAKGKIQARCFQMNHPMWVEPKREGLISLNTKKPESLKMKKNPNTKACLLLLYSLHQMWTQRKMAALIPVATVVVSAGRIVFLFNPMRDQCRHLQAVGALIDREWTRKRTFLTWLNSPAKLRNSPPSKVTVWK